MARILWNAHKETVPFSLMFPSLYIVVTPIEELIVQSCQLDNLVPSPNFQLAVHQVLHVYTIYHGSTV